MSSLKTTLNFIHPPPPPPSSFSPSLSSIKLKTLLQTLIFSHIYRALSKAKSLLIEHILHFIHFRKNKNKQKNQLFFGSFRLHYNWCSNSHHHDLPKTSCSNYAQVAPRKTEMQQQDSNDLANYLQWLEHNKPHQQEYSINEIDQLADMFIANCHEKFRLEKQESYRMFQEMMARSI